jgi:hypothetical protein
VPAASSLLRNRFAPARLLGVPHDPEAAARLLEKLRRLATDELDSDERVLLGVCLAPFVLAAVQSEGEEVEGFGFTRVGDQALVEALQEALRSSNLRIVEFGDPS